LATIVFVTAMRAEAAPLPMLIPCADRAAVVDTLGKQYGEHRRGLGLTLGGQLLEIFVAKNGHWSALLSYSDGKTCMIAVGEGWLDEPIAAGEQS
jgi:hypothetical protein